MELISKALMSTHASSFDTRRISRRALSSTHVDDALLASFTDPESDAVIAEISKLVKIEDLGRPTNFPGWNITFLATGIKFDQAEYIKGLIETEYIPDKTKSTAMLAELCLEEDCYPQYLSERLQMPKATPLLYKDSSLKGCPQDICLHKEYLPIYTREPLATLEHTMQSF